MFQLVVQTTKAGRRRLRSSKRIAEGRGGCVPVCVADHCTRLGSDVFVPQALHVRRRKRGVTFKRLCSARGRGGVFVILGRKQLQQQGNGGSSSNEKQQQTQTSCSSAAAAAKPQMRQQYHLIKGFERAGRNVAQFKYVTLSRRYL